ncbi:MAG: polyribonucleotide nucleotidyltransferase [bacterium]
MTMRPQKKEIDFQGNTLSIETGKYARQADGAVWLNYGGTTLLATAVSAKEEPERDLGFFPLTVDYIEKFYAAGKYPGGFIKRESQPSIGEKLTARLIDRPIRPLFPEWFQCGTQIIITLLSYDQKCDPKTIAITAASAALQLSDIPFEGPIAGCRIIKKEGDFIINPSSSEEEDAELNIVMAGDENSIMMVEGKADEASEEDVVKALELGHEAIKPLLKIQHELGEGVSREKRTGEKTQIDEKLMGFIKNKTSGVITEALSIADKLERTAFVNKQKSMISDLVKAEIAENNGEFGNDESDTVVSRAKSYYKDILKETMRKMIVKDKKRIDGRGLEDIRQINIDTGVLSEPHGSCVFTRGETQSLATVTLGIPEDEQRIDTVTREGKKQFMLHYNFPPFCVGENGFLRAPGRRELGHGNLAETAIAPVLPGKDDFLYTIRIVSEILESNGSSSQASICSGCLALMDAGVSVKKHVAGIAMGLIKDEDDYIILSDILGDEDHLGDMDFKVAGTRDGITAIQMDIKINGLPGDVLKKALEQANRGRMHILDKMEEAMPGPREDISPKAPRIEKIIIDQDKIRDLIGPDGKTIKSIVEMTGADISVEQTGEVIISADNLENLEETRKQVELHTKDVEVGKIYEGKVSRIETYGAFVDVLPGKTGLLHISNIADRRINSVTDEVNLGDTVKVIVTDKETSDKFSLSMKPSDFDKDHTQKPKRGGRDNRSHRDGGRRPRQRN